MRLPTDVIVLGAVLLLIGFIWFLYRIRATRETQVLESFFEDDEFQQGLGAEERKNEVPDRQGRI